MNSFCVGTLCSDDKTSVMAQITECRDEVISDLDLDDTKVKLNHVRGYNINVPSKLFFHTTAITHRVRLILETGFRPLN